MPEQFAALYKSLDDDLVRAEKHFESGSVETGRTVFMAELLSANSNVGERLLLPRARQANTVLLDRFKELGVGGIALSIQYPFLHPGHARSAEYLDLYRFVIAEARKRGMKVTIEFGTTFGEAAFSQTRIDYSGLTLEKFGREMHEMAAITLRELKPDWLTILSEPDTQAKNTGLDLSADNYIKFIELVTADLPKGATRIGAGAGTWSPPVVFEKLADVAALDYLDMHIYPIARGYMTDRIDTIAKLAKEHHKGLTVGESWLYKAETDELGHSIAAAAQLFGRDVYSFWSPLDARFFHCTIRMAQRNNLEFCSFFWARNFFGEVEFNDTTRNLKPAQLFELIRKNSMTNVMEGSLTPTGEAFKAALPKH